MEWLDRHFGAAVICVVTFGLAVVVLLGQACEDACTDEDREWCGQEWADCVRDGGDTEACGTEYCDCLADRGCRGSCSWRQACDDADGGE